MNEVDKLNKFYVLLLPTLTNSSFLFASNDSKLDFPTALALKSPVRAEYNDKTKRRQSSQVSSSSSSFTPFVASNDLLTSEEESDTLVLSPSLSEEAERHTIDPRDETPLFPYEILLKIFEYSSPKTLSRAAGVCRQWEYISKKNELWEPFLAQLGFAYEDWPSFPAKDYVIHLLRAKTFNSLFYCMPRYLSVDRLAALGYEGPIQVKLRRKMTELSFNHDSIRESIEELISQASHHAIDHTYAISYRLEGILKGTYGYRPQIKKFTLSLLNTKNLLAESFQLLKHKWRPSLRFSVSFQ